MNYIQLIFWQWQEGAFKVIWNLHRNVFCFSERNITTSFSMIHVKGFFVHYADLNPRSIKKQFLNYKLSNMLFLIIFSVIFLFTRMSNLVILKWRPNAKVLKKGIVSTTFCVWVFKKKFSHVISLFDCLYFLRYWEICVLKFPVSQIVTSKMFK